MASLEIPVIKLSNQHQGEPTTLKPVIVIVGRVRPTDTLSSIVIHGLLNLLFSQDPMVHKLRNNYEVWVLPMLNPDGVVVGNNSSNIEGKDLGKSFYVD